MSDIKQLKAEEVYKLYQDKSENDVFIDVRHPSEWAEGVIPGVLKIQLDALPDHVAHLDKDKNYVLICRSGNRSNNASKYFLSEGFTKVNNFDGGMLNWEAMAYPLE